MVNSSFQSVFGQVYLDLFKKVSDYIVTNKDMNVFDEVMKFWNIVSSFIN
jgi:hypothetical protein